MRIGIDCRTILNPAAGEKAGVAHYTYYLVKHLLAINKLDEFVLFFDHRAKNIVKEFLEPNTAIRFFTFSKYRKYLPFVYSHMLTASTIAYERLDVYHSPANVVPLTYRGKYVVTIHDLAIYREPNLFPPRQGFSIRYLVPRSVTRAAAVIAVSKSTRDDIQDFFRVPTGKINVVYEGVEHERFGQVQKPLPMLDELKARYRITRDYLLFVGTLEPRKNLIRLLEALYQAVGAQPELGSRYQLVIAGGRGWLYDEIFEEVNNRGLEQMVVFTGYVPAGEIVQLFAGATAFVYPSLYEGFGLPVLEAMAAGVPVITSNLSSLPELAGDAAVLVDPYDVEGLAAALVRVLTEPSLRAGLSERGRRRAAEFTWERCARETLGVYEAVGKMG